MGEAEEYRTLGKEGRGELCDRKSEFLAFARPVSTPEEALSFAESLRKLHHDAKHFVFAYVLRDGQKRYSDDGEPQGSAGRPVLDVLEKNGLCDAAVCVIRYFGGILLGTGGLVRAYSGSASAAVADAGIRIMKKRTFIAFTMSYNDWARAERPLNEAGAKVENTAFSDGVSAEISVPSGSEDRILSLLVNLSSGKCRGRVTGEKFS